MTEPKKPRTLREILLKRHYISRLDGTLSPKGQELEVELLALICAERLAERERCEATLRQLHGYLVKAKSPGAPWILDAADTVRGMPDDVSEEA